MARPTQAQLQAIVRAAQEAGDAVVSLDVERDARIEIREPPARTLIAVAAAEYLHLSGEEFAKRVEDGRLPGPIPGTRRWDRVHLEEATKRGYHSPDWNWLGAQRDEALRIPGGRVYFIRAGTSAIKIGVSYSPRERLQELQTAHYEELAIIGVMMGYERTEELLHARFTKERIRGEWFKASKRLLAFIEEFAQ